MPATESPFVDVTLSLADLVGEDYLEAVCEARSLLSGESLADLRAVATTPVSLYPADFHARLLDRLPSVGTLLRPTPLTSAPGATSSDFVRATHTSMAPLTGFGFYRLGEDGRLYLTTKSEHYHTPVGHSFPGYRLLDIARRLGIPNATHNNTRGHITRLLEQELVRTANGLAPEDASGLEATLSSTQPGVLNGVLNLETGSLAAEAALKMMLARFFRSQDDVPAPLYQGRTPVFLVLGNDDGGLHANYHGTTVLTQLLRGMWPEFLQALRNQGAFEVCAVRPNHLEDLDAAFARYEQPPYKLAGFFHEIVLMNYGARLLTREFLNHAYSLCAAHDVPVAVDEIQSCLWAPSLFLFREYDLKPSFVILGKGMPGGEYAASRLVFSRSMDDLPQFGALVTNGQEEIASLAYLVTMRWALANSEVTRQMGDYYQERLTDFADRHRDRIQGFCGLRHLGALAFDDLTEARSFVSRLGEKGLDASAQTYKADCPPVALTKLPLLACRRTVDFVLDRMEESLRRPGN
ncbi:MAG: aminotransferase class III-fold pyridoxal phosphate-dependent enzyme [Armatimonadia bacterium]